MGQVPRYRFPVGLRGRRDAFVLLTASLGLTRARIHQLAPADVSSQADQVRVVGRALPRGAYATSCPRCVVVRWLTVLGPAWEGDRGQVRDLLDVTRATPDLHDCDHDVGGGWGRADRIVVSLDTHGWVRPGVGLSTRTITAIVGTHRHRTGTREQIPVSRPASAGAVVPARDLDADQDELDARIAALLLRTTAALTEAADIHAHLTRHAHTT